MSTPFGSISAPPTTRSNTKQLLAINGERNSVQSCRDKRV
jgi:hypothetical protein